MLQLYVSTDAVWGQEALGKEESQQGIKDQLQS